MQTLKAVDKLALLAISAYQRYLSPYKGFCCAYRFHTGCASCSQLGFRVIRRFGLWQGLALLRLRLQRCAVAHRRFSVLPAARPKRQAGFCDLSCDLPCDFNLGWVGDAASGCCDLPGGCGDWKRDKNKWAADEKYIYIPPNTRGHRRPAPAKR
ncbi:MAG: membrane protein insertion efficiency factor YidD [Pseudomonadota bacterium]